MVIFISMCLQNATLHGLLADAGLQGKKLIMLKIKRPLAVIGFTFFITGTTVLSMPKEYTAVLLALLALFVFIHYKTRKLFTKHLLLILATSVAAVLYVNTYTCVYQKNVDSISTEKQIYTGYIKEITNPDNTGYIIALLDENNREMYNVSVYYANYFDIGDIVEIEGKFKPAKSDKYIFSNYSENIKGIISAENIRHCDVKINTVNYRALTVKKTLIESSSNLYNNEYLAIVNAIAFNDSHLVTSNIKSLFKSSGMSHALVVSGLHVGIVVMAVQFGLRYVPVNKKYKNVIAAIATIVYMHIVGLSPSVIRAGYLAITVLLTRNFHKEQDSFTTLALIGLVSVLFNPYITRNIGAMLSYAATIGIISANRWCKSRKIEDTKRDFICALAAVVFTIPILALAGMYVTVMSPVYNVMFALFVTGICVLSIVTPIINLIPVVNIINPFLVLVDKFLISSLLNVLAFIHQYMGFATIRLHSPLWKTVIFSAIVAMAVAYLQFDNKKRKNIFVISVSIFAFLCYNLLNWNTLTITAFDSGREGSFHIHTKGKEYIVLTEDMTAKEAEQRLISAFGNNYKTAYYCPKEFKVDVDMGMVSDKTIDVNRTGVFDEGYFTLTSEIDGGKKLFTISAAGCDISFGHGKIISVDSEYYFLGNDKPKEISAGEIYIFGNTPSWMNVENINNIDSDITIKINLKNGKYKTVKDVLNFGYRL